jgi:pSer/pThr/pTyr-binding forkhead associated (FHA) protein
LVPDEVAGEEPRVDVKRRLQFALPESEDPPIEPTVVVVREAVPGSRQPSGIVGVRLTGRDIITLGLGSFVVGRGAASGVRLGGRDVGRRHARLDVRHDGVSVEDLDSANGTFVNDEAITLPCEVPDGACLRFATTEWLVTYVRSGEPLS